MHRCGSGFLLILTIPLVAALTGCLGKSSSNSGNGGVETVTLNPGSNVSIDVGGTLNFSASGKNSLGGAVLGLNIQYVVTSGEPNGSAPLSLTSSGSACAGTWDTTGTQCNPGTSGIANVTAVIEGVSSPPTIVYVHQHVANIQIVQAESQPPQYDCFSAGQTWLFQGIAYNSSGTDITNTVGPMVWSPGNSAVVVTTPFVPPNQPNVLNQVQTLAKAPGITNLFASVSSTTSAPFPFTTCLIQAIYLQLGNQIGNSITVNNGGSIPVNAIAVDTLCGIANSAPLATPPLTWSTTDPEVAAFGVTSRSANTNTAAARSNLGGATLFASCSPPSCNIGVLPGLPIYASDYDPTNPPSACRPPNLTNQAYGAISVEVTNTKQPPTYTAWVATTGCGDTPGCGSALFPVTPGTTPIGPIANLPRTPNSMMFNHLATSRIYFGSNQGLMYIDATGTNTSATLVSNSSTPCNVSLCGKVLTISNDGTMVVVSDTVSSPSQVYIYNAGATSTAPVDLVLSTPGEKATAAAFSPDQWKLFILTDAGNMYVYSNVDALRQVQLANPATQVAFSADGSFAYVAGTPASAVTAYSTCSLPAPDPASVEVGSVVASSTPLEVFPSPRVPADPLMLTQTILALEPPNVEFLSANQFNNPPLPYNQFTCNPPILTSFTKGASFNLGQGNLTPVYAQLVDDGTEMIIVARKIPAVLLFNVANGTTTSVPLVGNTDPLAADASTDGSQIYVAACDQYAQDGTTCTAGSVHIVNTISQGDFQQVPYANPNDNNDPNMCSSQGTNAPLCVPNLIAIKPQ